MKNWKLWVAVAGLLGAIYFVAFHTSRFIHDFWPLDASAIAPNVVASVVQYILLGIAAYLLYPPIKRAVDAYTRRHLDELKAHVTQLHAETQAHAEDLHKTLHARLSQLEGKKEE
jgi:uncharacterized membrane protein